MTQMLLFDATTSGSLGAKTAVAPIVAVAPALPANSASATESIRKPANETAISEPHARGLNRMGDLARLVLLRHDLIAAQRQQRQSGRRAK